MIFAVLAIVTATFSPAAPAVGDPITIDFTAPVVLDPSPSYEIISGAAGFSPPKTGFSPPKTGSGGLKPAAPRRVVVRTFTPRPFALSGTVGGVRFRNLVVPVRSVLRRNDDLTPAPLTPPRVRPYRRAPFVAMAITALLAAATWALAWRLARQPARVIAPVISADDRFRRAVRDARNWAALADATRIYLAETRRHLGSELTTTELLPRLVEGQRVVVEILRQGDMEKFSREGASPRDFDEVAAQALELAS